MSPVPKPARPAARRLLRPLQLLALCLICAALLSDLADACGAWGLWPAAVLCGLLLWALLGEQLPGSAANLRYAGTLLVAGAGLRALGETLHAPRLGLLALGLECYAAATLAGERRRPCSPRAHTLICALSAQSDSLLQRSVGYGLRHG
jgi:hypothetical protein